jgi:2-hydroxy-3-keto-5-methylthiopentenyl-1-phosphate phosphatase
VAKTGAGEVVLIGDGHSDICLAGLASFVFARRDTPLHRHCLENGLPHAAYNDFFDMLQFLEQFHLHTAQERPYGKN